MADERDYCLALNELVNAIYFYTDVDPDWTAPTTKLARDGRTEMERAAQKLSHRLINRPFNRAELDLIFDWTRDELETRKG